MVAELSFHELKKFFVFFFDSLFHGNSLVELLQIGLICPIEFITQELQQRFMLRRSTKSAFFEFLMAIHKKLVALLEQLGPLRHLVLQTNPGRFILIDDAPDIRGETFAHSFHKLDKVFTFLDFLRCVRLIHNFFHHLRESCDLLTSVKLLCQN